MDTVNPYSVLNEPISSWLQNNNKSFCTELEGKKVCMLGPSTNLLSVEDIEFNIRQTILKQSTQEDRTGRRPAAIEDRTGLRPAAIEDRTKKQIFVFSLDTTDLETLLSLSQTRNWAELFPDVHLKLGCFERKKCN